MQRRRANLGCASRPACIVAGVPRPAGARVAETFEGGPPGAGPQPADGGMPVAPRTTTCGPLHRRVRTSSMRAGPGCALCLLLAACGGGGAGTATPVNPSPPQGTPPSPTQRTDVVTYKNDLARSGQNLTESVLTPANVNSSGFGLLRFLAADGKVDAQPLYLSGLSVGGAAAQRGVRGHRERFGVCLRCRQRRDALARVAARCRERRRADRTAAIRWRRRSA